MLASDADIVRAEVLVSPLSPGLVSWLAEALGRPQVATHFALLCEHADGALSRIERLPDALRVTTGGEAAGAREGEWVGWGWEGEREAAHVERYVDDRGGRAYCLISNNCKIAAYHVLHLLETGAWDGVLWRHFATFCEQCEH